jgi:catalase
MDLKALPTLSIIKNGPKNFADRTVGIFITDGVDAKTLSGLLEALKHEKARAKLIAPQVGGVKASDGKWIPADEKMGGGPSVLYDAVALLPSEEGAALLAEDPAVRDFIADALSHRKFIAYSKHATGLLENAGSIQNARSQLVLLNRADASQIFVERCRSLRSWDD